MMRYFVSKSTVQHAFGEKGVSVFVDNNLTIQKSINGKEGWLIQSISCDMLLKICNGKIINKLPTGTPDVIELMLAPLHGAIKPQRQLVIKPGVLDSFEGKNKEMFKNTIRDIFLPLDKYSCVDMRTSRSSTIPLCNPSTFYIHIYSAPHGSPHGVVPTRIWDTLVETKMPTYESTWEGLPIVDEATGYVVAELFDDNLYIYHNIVEYGSQHENTIFRNILTKTINLLYMSAKEKVLYKESTTKHKFAGERLKYIDHCKKRIHGETALLTGSVSTKKKEIEQLQKELTQKIREAQALEQKLGLFDTKRGDVSIVFGREFDKLMSMPKVIKVEIGRNNIVVYTKTLYCKHPKTKNIHEIGKFKITIPTSEGGSVKWENLTRKVDGMNNGQMAPHIWNDGTACLGNTDKLFPALIAQFEFSTLVMMAIEFVESVNITDAAGKHLDRWPIATRIET